MSQTMKTILFFIVGSVALLVMIGFSGVKHSSRVLNDVRVDIETQDGNYFIDKADVMNLLQGEDGLPVVGSALGDLDLKSLEHKVRKNPFVKDSEIYKDLKGNLMVRVKLAKPIARIFNSKGDDIYIDDEGYLLPARAKQTARVPIVELDREFSWEENITETTYGQNLLSLLKYIGGHKFWSAQIAHIVVGQEGKITMIPQVSKQEIIFGLPKDFDRKFKKLEVFYKEILPNKGWNTYSKVNLEFENQIVCQK